ncbi:unnamed protein product, partial [marine sediment metagenome]
LRVQFEIIKLSVAEANVVQQSEGKVTVLFSQHARDSAYGLV